MRMIEIFCRKIGDDQKQMQSMNEVNEMNPLQIKSNQMKRTKTHFALSNSCHIQFIKKKQKLCLEL